MQKDGNGRINAGTFSQLVNSEIVLIDWDWPNEKGPKCVEAIISKSHGIDKYEISLANPIALPDGSKHRNLIIEGRHKGHPINKIFPNFIRRLLIFKHPLSRMFVPFIAVNVSTENGLFFSRACIYLKSVYLKVMGDK